MQLIEKCAKKLSSPRREHKPWREKEKSKRKGLPPRNKDNMMLKCVESHWRNRQGEMNSGEESFKLKGKGKNNSRETPLFKENKKQPIGEQRLQGTKRHDGSKFKLKFRRSEREKNKLRERRHFKEKQTTQTTDNGNCKPPGMKRDVGKRNSKLTKRKKTRRPS